MSASTDRSQDLTITISSLPGGLPVSAGQGRAERRYLLVFTASSSSMFHLPAQGEVTIGRALDCQLRLDDGSASRTHARLLLSERSAEISDLNSHNGTLVNGERISAPRELADGDIVSICGVTLVFHGDALLPQGRPVRSEAELRQRLEEETERSLRYHHPVSVLCLDLGAPADPAAVAGRLAGQVQLIDVVAWGGADQLLVLLPELEEDEVADTAARVLRALVSLYPEARAGLATCPTDGADVDTLLSSARGAARRAAPGECLAAREAATTLTVGERTVIVADPAMVRLFALLERLADSELPVLISGETGTGKEIAATAVHGWSRRTGRLLALNCAALPETMVESELFGYERGAFTGAGAPKPGLLESASSGTVFLDEVGELSPAAQAKLLRVLESKRVCRLGGVKEREVDIRVVAATNRNLEDEVRTGRFRQDLFFRLSAASVVLPPLRDRRRELPILARAFLTEACGRSGRGPMAISALAMERLLSHLWPGNLRELKNLMDYVAAAVPEDVLEAWHLPKSLADRLGPPGKDGDRDPAESPEVAGFRPIEQEVQELERRRMADALLATRGNHKRAAELISMPLRTFATKFKRYGLAEEPTTRRG